MKFIKYIIPLFLVHFLLSCGQQQTSEHTHEDSPAHDHGDDHNTASETEEVHLVKKQMDVMGIELGKFEQLNLSTTVKANGLLELPPQNKASLSAVMGGRVKSVNILIGEHVKKGQVLAYLEHPDYIELQEQYMSSKSELEYLKNEYARKKGLYADSISSAKVFQQSEANFKSKVAKVNGLKSKLKMLDIDVHSVEKGNFLSSIPVRSPINGFVRLIEINVGKYVQPQQEMFEIVDNDHIHIDLKVYEKDMDKVEIGQKVVFSLTNKPSKVFQGEVFALGKSFEQDPKAMLVHAEIDNKKGNILPGMYVDARIITNNKMVQAIPNDAIVSDGGLDYIFVLKPSTTSEESNHTDEYIFRKIEVATGAKDMGFTEVVPAYNLPDHVQIVNKGAFYLLAEMKKGEGGHGHHH